MDTSDKIVRFLNEEMSKEERAQFLIEVEKDPLLKGEVHLQKTEKEAIDLLFEDEYQQKIKMWRGQAIEEVSQQDNSIDSKTIRKRVDTKKYLAIAASVLILIIAGTYFWAILNYSDSAILTENFSSPNNSLRDVSLRGGDVRPPETLILAFDKAKESFFNKNYNQTIEDLSALSETNPQIQYLLAHAYLQKKEYTDAIPLFRTLANGTGVFNKEAKLYLMYTLLANEQTENEEFNTLLDQIIVDDNYPKTVRQNTKAIKEDLSGFGRRVFELIN